MRRAHVSKPEKGASSSPLSPVGCCFSTFRIALPFYVGIKIDMILPRSIRV